MLWVQALGQKMEITYYNCNNRSCLCFPTKYIGQITKLYSVFHACHRGTQHLFTQITKIPVSTFGPAKMEVLKSRHKIPSIAIRSHFCFSSIRVLLNCQTKGILPKPINV